MRKFPMVLAVGMLLTAFGVGRADEAPAGGCDGSPCAGASCAGPCRGHCHPDCLLGRLHPDGHVCTRLWQWLTYQPLEQSCCCNCCQKCEHCCRPPLYYFFLCRGCGATLPPTGCAVAGYPQSTCGCGH